MNKIDKTAYWILKIFSWMMGLTALFGILYAITKLTVQAFK